MTLQDHILITELKVNGSLHSIMTNAYLISVYEGDSPVSLDAKLWLTELVSF